MKRGYLHFPLLRNLRVRGPQYAPQDGLCARIYIRRNTTNGGPAPKYPLKRSPPANAPQKPLRSPTFSPAGKTQPPPKRPASRPPEVVIYHAGTGRIAYIGMLRLATTFIFIVSCAVVVPAYHAADSAWYTPLAILACGTIPMLFVSYTAAPFVNQVFLKLPAAAQASREQMLSYLKNIPRDATLSIETMQYNFYPRRAEVSLARLVPSQSYSRPVSFRRTDIDPVPWWKGGRPMYFFTSEKSRPAKSTSRFYPDVWEHVFGQIKANASH